MKVPVKLIGALFLIAFVWSMLTIVSFPINYIDNNGFNGNSILSIGLSILAVIYQGWVLMEVCKE